jgi:hypothetical protein
VLRDVNQPAKLSTSTSQPGDLRGNIAQGVLNVVGRQDWRSKRDGLGGSARDQLAVRAEPSIAAGLILFGDLLDVHFRHLGPLVRDPGSGAV